VREKLRIFPFRQYIVGNVVFLAFWWRSQVQNRNGGCEEMYKNVNTVSDEIFRTKIRQSRHSRRYRWRYYHWQATRLLRKYIGRCLCKCVDVYIITLSCTWRIYALSERLLVTSAISLSEITVNFKHWEHYVPGPADIGKTSSVTGASAHLNMQMCWFEQILCILVSLNVYSYVGFICINYVYICAQMCSFRGQM